MNSNEPKSRTSNLQFKMDCEKHVNSAQNEQEENENIYKNNDNTEK